MPRFWTDLRAQCFPAGGDYGKLLTCIMSISIRGRMGAERREAQDEWWTLACSSCCFSPNGHYLAHRIASDALLSLDEQTLLLYFHILDVSNGEYVTTSVVNMHPQQDLADKASAAYADLAQGSLWSADSACVARERVLHVHGQLHVCAELEILGKGVGNCRLPARCIHD